jgi:hypothetical protein
MGDIVRDKRNPGWTWINGEIIKVYAAQIKTTAVAVYCALCSFTNNDSQDCFPSHATLCTLLGISEPTLRTALDKLIEYGLIEVDARFGDNGQQTSNLYTLMNITGKTGENFIPSGGIKKFYPPEVKNLPLTRLNELDSINIRAPSAPEDTARLPTGTPARRKEDAAESAVVAHFTTISGLRIRGSEKYARWYNPARELLQMVDWDVDKATRIVTAAHKQMKGDKLTFDSIQSIMRVASYLLAQDVAPARTGIKEW